MEISWPQFHYSTGISEILARHYRMVSCILNRLDLNVESQNLIFGKSESMKVLSVTAYDYFITTSAMRKECEHKSSSCWLDKQWNWAKSPKSLLPSANLKRYNLPFLVGGREAGDFTTEGLWLDAYDELVPVDLKALRSSMVLLGFALISSLSIMYPLLPLSFLWNKHSSGKIKNSKQRPLDPHSYIHWGGRTVRQSIKKSILYHSLFISMFRRSIMNLWQLT